MTVSERNRLPGGPSNALVRRVRSRLAWYGIRPTYKNGELWHLAWEWANKVATSYFTSKHWPLANEIAAQYVFLLLNAMRASRDLNLPFRAAEQMPASVRNALPATVHRTDGPLALPAPLPDENVA